MKIQYKLGLLAIGALVLSSCNKYDVFQEVAPVGQAVPEAYWQLNSSVCKAGESFGFQGKYNPHPGMEIDRSEVWYQIVRQEEASVVSKLGGASLGYTHKSTKTDTIRSLQSCAVFPHSLAVWDGHEFIIDGEVPVSRTLSPVKWADIATWDQENFDNYYPEGFAEGFLEKVIGYLTDPETTASYYNALRSVYISYDFTNEQFAAVGLPAIDMEQPEADKSDKWYSTTEASDDAVVGYYYLEVVNGENVAKEISKEAGENWTGDVPVYPVYDSSAWLFCRYDDNAGAIVTSIRSEWLPKFRTLIEQIPFEAWIYDSANSCYKVDFSRKYSLNAVFRVYDTKGEQGQAYDRLTIDIN